MDEPDISNFSTSSSHRLPTISASQALQNAKTRSKGIPSSLPKLDNAFPNSAAAPISRGISRGQVTELYGPSGVGKTAFAMQVASNALHAGDRVVWIDTGAPLPAPRFRDILESYNIPAGQEPPSSPPTARTTDELLEDLICFNVYSLPHLLVLFLHPTAKFPPERTALVVIDNISAPFATAFPRSFDTKLSTIDFARKNKVQWAANRKWAVAGDLATAMNKMGALKNIAVLVINQVAASIKGVRKAVLKPAIGGAAWETAIHNRLVLWRDLPSSDNDLEESTVRGMRFAQIVKAGGKGRPISADEAVPFIIVKGGLQEVNLGLTSARDTLPILKTTSTSTFTFPSTKRKADEIADSEEEEGDEIGSDDDFGIPDDHVFNKALLDND